MIALPRSHRTADDPNLSIADLTDEKFIFWPVEQGRGFHLTVVRLCADAGVVPDMVQEVHGMHRVLSLVATETGVSIVPASMSGFRSDRICHRPISDKGADFSLALCYRTPIETPALHELVTTAVEGMPRCNGGRSGR
ncbi:UNVERIFIED_ORG: DNA-binding transcriptional LysR family regulator [Ensifer adhaerens]|nr:DNA-binding transcriptional LysR family regulator [Ensifer adhaerens]